MIRNVDPSPARAPRRGAAWLLPGTALLALGCGASVEDTGGGGIGGPRLPGNPTSIPLEFTVRNESAFARTETIRASVPFPQGARASLGDVVVTGKQTAWQVLQRWPDGTVRIGQAQFTDTLPANSTRTYPVTYGTSALSSAFTPHPWVAAATALQIGAHVEDTFHVAYRAFVTGAGEVLSSTPLVRVKRYRTYHQAVSAPGIGRDYLTSTFYVTEFRDTPFQIVDWVLGNDYLGADAIPPGNTDKNLRPLGMIDVTKAAFLVSGMATADAYRGSQEAISGPTHLGAGLFEFPVMSNTYLEDGQTRRYRFQLYFEDPAAPQQVRDDWRQIGGGMLGVPLMPLATLRTWQDTAGAGLLGGPIDGPTDAPTRANTEWTNWANAGHFGTWGSRGDPQKTGTTGTPRNGPMSQEFAHAIQANNHWLLIKLEQMAWAQAMRPYHLYGLQVGAEQDILLWDATAIYPGSRDLSGESLGRRALWANDPYAAYRTLTVSGYNRAHDWEAYDHEHWSTDLLFDYWTVSGDAWAKEELRQLGQSLKSLMRLTRYSTAYMQAARAEGWTMQGFAQVYLATGDASIKDYALRRVHEIVDVQRLKNHASKAIVAQGDYAGTGYPTPHQFFMPWQHGAVLYGYLGAYRFFEDPLMLAICEDVVTTVEYSWVTNFQDQNFGRVADGLRYYVPYSYNGVLIPPNYWDNPPTSAKFGDSPLGGAHTFLIGGLYTLAEWSGSSSVRQRALRYAEKLWPAADNTSRWDKWHFGVPVGMVP